MKHIVVLLALLTWAGLAPAQNNPGTPAAPAVSNPSDGLLVRGEKGGLQTLSGLQITNPMFGLESYQNKLAALSLDGKPVLQISVPAAAKVAATNGCLKIAATNLQVYIWSATHLGSMNILATNFNLQLYIWAVPGAKTIAEAVPRSADIIKSEFIQFQPTATNEFKNWDVSATDLTGPGKEADDEDPGNAEVVLFTVDGRVFAACVHGEFDDAKPEHIPMLAVLHTAQAPGAGP